MTEKKYRPLASNEVLAEGDEFLVRERWTACHAMSGTVANLFGPDVRRPLNAQTELKAEPERRYQMLKTGDVLREGDEWRYLHGASRTWRKTVYRGALSKLDESFVAVRRPIVQEAAPFSCDNADDSAIRFKASDDLIEIKADPYAAHRARLAARGIMIDQELRTAPDNRPAAQIQHEDEV